MRTCKTCRDCGVFVIHSNAESGSLSQTEIKFGTGAGEIDIEYFLKFCAFHSVCVHPTVAFPLRSRISVDHTMRKRFGTLSCIGGVKVIQDVSGRYAEGVDLMVALHIYL